MRTELHERGGAFGQQRADDRSEPHGATQVSYPVVGIELVTRDRTCVDRRVQRQRTITRHEPGQRLAQWLEQWIHLRAVGGHVDIDAPLENLAPFEAGEEIIERSWFARHHGRAQLIAHGHEETVTEFGHRLACFLEAKLDERHCTLAACLAHQATA